MDMLQVSIEVNLKFRSKVKTEIILGLLERFKNPIKTA